jgi:hypothetical protein
MNASATTHSIESVALFLPMGAKQAFVKTSEVLQNNNVPIEQSLEQALSFGATLIEQGLDSVITLLEMLIEQLYDFGVMEQIGYINSFARDGVEIVMQLGLNTLKAMEPEDVAAIAGLTMLAWLSPNLLVLNSPDVIELVSELALKWWHMP